MISDNASAMTHTEGLGGAAPQGGGPRSRPEMNKQCGGRGMQAAGTVGAKARGQQGGCEAGRADSPTGPGRPGGGLGNRVKCRVSPSGGTMTTPVSQTGRLRLRDTARPDPGSLAATAGSTWTAARSYSALVVRDSGLRRLPGPWQPGDKGGRCPASLLGPRPRCRSRGRGCTRPPGPCRDPPGAP